jgi:hypothetical protein
VEIESTIEEKFLCTGGSAAKDTELINTNERQIAKDFNPFEKIVVFIIFVF